MHMLRFLLAVAAVVTGSSVFATEAQADKVRLDNSPDGGVIEDTGSGDNYIFVSVKFCGGGWTSIGQQQLSSVSESHDYTWTSTPTTRADQITNVKIQTNGDNWFWLDQFHGINSSGGIEWTKGVDNTQGWCLSFDSGDGSDAVCEPDDSFATHEIAISGANC